MLKKCLLSVPVALYAASWISPACAGTLLVSNDSPVRVFVPVDDSLSTNWVTTLFDDASWIIGTNGVGFAASTAGYAGDVLADSVRDWSVSGIQGESYWINGYYDRTNDDDGSYSANDLTWINDEWYWRSQAWEMGANGNPAANPPWVRIGDEGVHPNGVNNAFEAWAMRRWISDYAGDVTVVFHLRKANGANSGITGKMILNGNEIFSQVVPGNDQVGFEVRTNLTVQVGDLLDFAQTPIGVNGATSDGSDSGFMTAQIISGFSTNDVPTFDGRISTDIESVMLNSNASAYIRIPFQVDDPSAIDTLRLRTQSDDGYRLFLNGQLIEEQNAAKVIQGAVIASSIDDWSTNPQVVSNGWMYGYFDRSADADGNYQAAEFAGFPVDGTATLSSSNYWNGTLYDWFQGNPPWTQLAQESAHPAGGGASPEHWVIRRWEAQTDGDLKARFRLRKENVNCGNGVEGLVFHNDVEVFRQLVNFNDGVGFDVEVDLPGVVTGDTVDFILSPNGADGCDGSAFSAEMIDGVFVTPWNGNAVSARTLEDAVSGTTIDLTAMIPDLNPGVNVIAYHGLNVSSNDPNFFLQAELEANRFPVTSLDSFSLEQPNQTNLSMAALLSNDVDPDGDMLVFSSVDSVSDLGGSISVVSNEIVYIPPAPITLTGRDTFTYRVTDGAAATVTGLVEVILTADVSSPTIVAGQVLPTLRQIQVEFSEEMDPVSVTNSNNYNVAPGIAVNSVTQSLDGRSVTLNLDQSVVSNTVYQVGVSGVTDTTGNSIDPNPSFLDVDANFLSCFAKAEFWYGITGSAISNLTNDVRYPEAPDEVRFIPRLEIRSNQAANYGVKVSGWLRPPLTGPYNFAISSDDNGEFWLSTNVAPDNVQRICYEPVWNGPRNWTGTDRRNASAPENLSETIFSNGINLVAGELYYFEALMKEGGGGDNLGVTWQVPGGPAISSTNLPIAGEFIYTLDEELGATLTILTQPQDALVYLPAIAPSAGFSVAATGAQTNSLITPLIATQWQRNDGGGWYDLADEVNTNLSVLVTSSDQGALFRARVSLPGEKAFSDSARLTVATRIIDGILPNGDAFDITIPAVAGLTYVLERTLDTANASWQVVNTVLAGSDGPLSIADPNPPEDRAYYRIVVP